MKSTLRKSLPLAVAGYDRQIPTPQLGTEIATKNKTISALRSSLAHSILLTPASYRLRFRLLDFRSSHRKNITP